ncbi:uncharacterized protein LOC144656333 [Oculina patagonica]
MTAKPTKIHDNLTRRERQALKKLQHRTDIVIKPADKGSGTVVMNRQDYLKECHRQLNDAKFYKKVTKDPTPDVNKRVQKYLDGLLKDKAIDKNTYKYLSPVNPRPGRFYILPKLHKQGHPGRPIVSANGHPTEKISEFVSYHLNPLVQTLPSYIKNTTHLLNKLKQITDLPPNALLVTLDVSSLYTNIPTNEGINACRKALDARSQKDIRTEAICDLIRIILNMNNFEFNNEHFMQLHGTAMGTRMAPAFANLFMGDFETKALDSYPDKPFIWWRYIDDIFMIWTLGEDKLDDFIKYLNNIHHTIKFTSERSTTSIPFLDVDIHLNNGKIETDLYSKPTDKHQYLLNTSSHPYHTKRSIPYSLALLLRRICSTENFFEHRVKELQQYLVKRGYKQRFISEQIDRARLVSRAESLQEHTRETRSDRVPLVITYNPALRNIQKILHNKQPLLNSSSNCKEIFKETPVVSYRRSPNLRDLLVRAKLKGPNQCSQPPPGTFLCNSNHRCLTCPHIEDGKTTYTFSSTNEVRQIKHHITCNSTNLVYMIQCKRCNKQYVGETKRTLRERFTEHRQASNNPRHKKAATAVPTHFNMPGHCTSDMSLVPLELLPTKSTSRRKAREAYLIDRGKTLEPNGLNRRSEQ